MMHLHGEGRFDGAASSVIFAASARSKEPRASDCERSCGLMRSSNGRPGERVIENSGDEENGIIRYVPIANLTAR